MGRESVGSVQYFGIRWTSRWMRSSPFYSPWAILPARKKKKQTNDDDDEVMGIVTEGIDFTSFDEQLTKSVDQFASNLAALRVERLSPSLLENIMVELPDPKAQPAAKKKSKPRLTPLRNVAEISILDHRNLVVHAHDAELIKAITKALTSAEGGFIPQPHQGNSLKVPVPKMTTEYREHLEKSVTKLGEDAKEAMRRARKDTLDGLKKAKSKMSKDEVHRQEKQLQDIIDKKTKLLTEKMAIKLREIKSMQ